MQPQQSYFLLDVGRIAKDQLTNRDSLPTLLFRMEQARTLDEIEQAIHDANERLHAPRYQELRLILGEWAVHVALKRIGMVDEKMPDVIDLKEVGNMLETNALHWKDEFIEKGQREARMDIARNLADMDMNEEQIIQATGLSREEVQQATSDRLQV